MVYVLRDKIKIEHPIVFLCGPYYNKDDKSDRRKILSDTLISDYKCLPLIIDNFLTPKNIDDETISIQLLEEIFAGISLRTYIFLDTMSSAVELGLFTNNAYNNPISVFVPHDEDRNCGTIGVFVNDNVLNVQKKRIKKVCYHPKIERVAISTDYVSEYYKFVNNVLPSTLRKSIDDDFNNVNNEYEIKLNNCNEYPQNDFTINYQFDMSNNTLIVFISVKLLFYIVGGTIYKDYSFDLTNGNVELTQNATERIISQLITLIKFLFLKKNIGIDNNTKILIQTVIQKNIKDIVKHIISFIFTYHKMKRVRGYYLIHHNGIFKDVTSIQLPQVLFNLEYNDYDLINRFDISWFKEYEINKGSKKRKIITYQENKNGEDLRLFHKKISDSLYKNYKFSKYSYAYQKGKSVVDCVNKHKNSSYFLKFDIHKFFNSIEIHKLAKQITIVFQLDKNYEKQLLDVLNLCFKNNKMPIGLITSPILSDIYMYNFDLEFSRRIGEKFIYTRYADDILISSPQKITDVEKEKIRSILSEMLHSLGLRINDRKSLDVVLNKRGNHIKYLGLNIVKDLNENKITVGKEYKNYIAKCYMQFILMENGEEKYYFGKKISGYLSFVKMVEGQEGLDKVYKRIKKNSRGAIDIHDKIEGL